MMQNKIIPLSEELKIEFQDRIKSIFDENLVFAFIFGSFAKGYGSERHDLDTFICVKSNNLAQNASYLIWLQDVHRRYGLTIDTAYPYELVEKRTLDNLAETASDIRLSAYGVNDPHIYDQVVCIQIFSDKKSAIIGDEKSIRHYTVSFKDYPELWKSTALEHIAKPERYQNRPAVHFLKNFYRFEERPMKVPDMVLWPSTPVFTRNSAFECRGK